MMLPGILTAIAAGCITVSGDQITAGDLAPRVPALATVPAETPLGYAPALGARRYFRPAELRRILSGNGVEDKTPLATVCVERASRALDADTLAAALHKTWAGDDVRIEILTFPHARVPIGEIVVPAAGAARLGTDPSVAQWRAFVRYSGNRVYRFAFTARVHATATRLVAAKPLRTGQTIEESDVAEQAYEGIPQPADQRMSAAQVLGQIVQRPIAEGTELRPTDVDAPPVVRRGDVVTALYRSDTVQLKTSARANQDGGLGEVISLCNEDSGKTLTARVVGPALVAVESGPTARRTRRTGENR